MASNQALIEGDDSIFCPHCGTVELRVESSPRWATDQVERWVWVCTGCDHVYIWDEVWPLADNDYEIAAWTEHVDSIRAKLSHWDIVPASQLINEPFPLHTLFADRVVEWNAEQ